MLKQYIVQIVYIVVFILLVELLLPSSKYKKYFDLCTGFIIITIMLNPITTFISKDLKIASANFVDMYFLERKDLMMDKDLLTNRQNDTIIKLYIKNLEDKIEEILKEMDIKLEHINIHINTDKKSDTFGRIEKINMIVSSKNTTTKRGIGKIEIKRRVNKDLDKEQLIKDKLLENLGVETEKINIRMQEK